MFSAIHNFKLCAAKAKLNNFFYFNKLINPPRKSIAHLLDKLGFLST